MSIQDAIALAKKALDRDPHLANYILRDTQEVKAAGLGDLAWVMHRESPSKDDILHLIEHLEKYLAGGMAQEKRRSECVAQSARRFWWRVNSNAIKLCLSMLPLQTSKHLPVLHGYALIIV